MGAISIVGPECKGFGQWAAKYERSRAARLTFAKGRRSFDKRAKRTDEPLAGTSGGRHGEVSSTEKLNA